jgi:peptidoglycan/LPS O-acetylase OafA/YrhL
MGRGLALYGLSSLLLIGMAGGVFTALYGSGLDRRAIWVSAGIALLVQLIAFAIARLLAAGGNGIAGWALGAVICLTVLVIYGFASRALGLPSNTAMLSLATYFFLTELIEPPLLTV